MDLITFLSVNQIAFRCFSFAISLPSTLLYCAQIWTILWHKPFHNSFYTLFVVRAIADLLYIVDAYLCHRLPDMSPEWFLHLELPNWLLTFFMFLGSYSFCADNLAMAFILLNRFTAIIRPVTHEIIWRKFMPLVLLIIFGIPLYSIGLFWIKIVVSVNRDGQGKAISIDYREANNGTTLSSYIGLTSLWSLLFLAFCIPINVAILYAYRKRQQQQISHQSASGNTAANAKREQIEKRLLFFAVITFCGHIIISLMLLQIFSPFWIALYLALATGNMLLATLMMSQYGLAMDLGLVLLPSWLLLWASSSFRRQLIVTFMPTILHEKMFGTPHTNSIKAQSAIMVKGKVSVKPMQISSIPKN